MPEPTFPNQTEHAPRARRPVVIGIVGGIGSGKSTVAQVLASLGCVVTDSDAIARAALDRADVRETLVSWWGIGILRDDAPERVDRAAVARIVFADPAERNRLESLIHPVVHAERRRFVEQARAGTAPPVAIVVDAPLLFEAGVDRECDAVIFVDAPLEERVKRVRGRRTGGAAADGSDGAAREIVWNEAELHRREAAQMPLDLKRARSNYVVANAGSREELRERVAAVLQRILDAHARTAPG